MWGRDEPVNTMTRGLAWFGLRLSISQCRGRLKLLWHPLHRSTAWARRKGSTKLIYFLPLFTSRPCGVVALPRCNTPLASQGCRRAACPCSNGSCPVLIITRLRQLNNSSCMCAAQQLSCKTLIRFNLSSRLRPGNLLDGSLHLNLELEFHLLPNGLTHRTAGLAMAADVYDIDCIPCG